jgi:hypothetical protein
LLQHVQMAARWAHRYILLEHGSLEEARRASAEANRLAAAVDHPDILGRTFIHLASAETHRGAWDCWLLGRAVEVQPSGWTILLTCLHGARRPQAHPRP